MCFKFLYNSVNITTGDCRRALQMITGSQMFLKYIWVFAELCPAPTICTHTWNMMHEISSWRCIFLLVCGGISLLVCILEAVEDRTHAVEFTLCQGITWFVDFVLFMCWKIQITVILQYQKPSTASCPLRTDQSACLTWPLCSCWLFLRIPASSVCSQGQAESLSLVPLSPSFAVMGTLAFSILVWLGNEPSPEPRESHPIMPFRAKCSTRFPGNLLAFPRWRGYRGSMFL